MITKTRNAVRQPARGGPMFLNEGWSHSRERRHPVGARPDLSSVLRLAGRFLLPSGSRPKSRIRESRYL